MQNFVGLLCCEALDLRRMVHGTELGTAHGAEGGFLEAFFGKGLVVHGAGGFGVER